ncbi:hypothetical protein COT83_05260 [Candidatus Peregrinibacteria bacterium CG10_big_fil_rev_8_21_14_0_10_44_7]|nr:MAG: hypothetical protein AUK45_01025 [Candidatus Peregrinibacteria bacterium CG2_30_44_17]PIS03592.1 MAG: hypothetical protein COT83_05260 [Candidatus Peregrinibacteria bacterium CG10_big_fil_rev_8_21_14_0_10_44_7]PIX80613.1 MAG: hypothetical protein COZ35_00220 [Candidatus Peregrinibacteria bacterium CG_4_10_14_3_um_filter_44_21]
MPCGTRTATWSPALITIRTVFIPLIFSDVEIVLIVFLQATASYLMDVWIRRKVTVVFLFRTAVRSTIPCSVMHVGTVRIVSAA